MSLFALAELENAAELVHAVVPATPQYAWPLLARHTGAEVWVKHENHTPIGAFKVRGGITYIDWLRRSSAPGGVISATRGNHGQSIAFAARRAGIPVSIVVPHGNSEEKNAAMESLGAELIVHGRDFDEARAHAARVAQERSLHVVPSFHPLLVKGVASYALELFRAVPSLDAVYAPIGLGSGICGVILVRDLLRLRTEIIGVVAEEAPALARSIAAGKSVPTQAARTFAPMVWPAASRILRRWRSSPRAPRGWCALGKTRLPRRCAPTMPPRTTWPRAPARPRSPAWCGRAGGCAAAASR
jgi:threonine dehydratase